MLNFPTFFDKYIPFLSIFRKRVFLISFNLFYNIFYVCLYILSLVDSTEFYYTRQGENPTIPGVDDVKEFQDTCEALSLLGIYSEQQRMLWRILAAILHLGNVSIVVTNKKNEDCGIPVCF